MKSIAELIACICLCAIISGCVFVPHNNICDLASYHVMQLGGAVDYTPGFLFYEASLFCPKYVINDLKIKIDAIHSLPYEEEEDDIPFDPESSFIVMHSDKKKYSVIGISKGDINALYIMPVYKMIKIEGGFLFYMCNQTYIRRFVDVELYSEIRKAMSEIK